MFIILQKEIIFSGLRVRSSHGNNLIRLTNTISMKGPLTNTKILAIINEYNSRTFHKEHQKIHTTLFLVMRNNSHYYSPEHSKYQAMVTISYPRNDP